MTTNESLPPQPQTGVPGRQIDQPGTRSYSAPRLTEYGSLTTLTQATGTVNGDAGQGMMM